MLQGPNQSELKRDFTYIDDIVDGIMGSLAEIPPSVKGKAHYKVRSPLPINLISCPAWTAPARMLADIPSLIQVKAHYKVQISDHLYQGGLLLYFCFTGMFGLSGEISAMGDAHGPQPFLCQYVHTLEIMCVICLNASWSLEVL